MWSSCSAWRRYLLGFLLALVAAPVLGQGTASEDSTKWRPYQIGFAASAFVTVLEEEEAPDQYQLYGRYRVDRQWAARVAFGYRQLVGDGNEMRLSVRFGVDHALLQEGPLRLYSGVDVVTGYDRFLNGDRTHRVGLSPLLGVLFFITPNISFSTEPRLVGRYTYDRNRSSPEPDTDSYFVGVRGTGVIILSVHF